jgi:hypothetical protein
VRVLKQSTAYNLMVLMVDSTDHVTGKTGLTLTVTASKDGAAFASISPTVTERTNGWYQVALTSSHTDTLGDLIVRATGTAADPAEAVCQVRANVLGDTLPANVTQFGGSAGTFASGRPEVNATHFGGTAVASATVQANVASIAGQAAVAAASVTFPANVGSSTLDAAGVRTAVGLASANLDTQLGDLPTANENADALLGRNVAGGSSTGRLVKEALYVLRNKVAISAGTMTVYATDDTTSAFTASVTTTAGNPVTAIDPA